MKARNIERLIITAFTGAGLTFFWLITEGREKASNFFYGALPAQDREVMQKYDVNSDGKLDKNELSNMLRDYQLTSRHARLEAEN